jgi:hypothetical protein
LVVNGDEVELSGDDDVSAAGGDGDGSDLQYLVINSDLAEDNFNVSGDVTVSITEAFDTSNEEGVAMDVVLE